MIRFALLCTIALNVSAANADQPATVFNGKSLEAWEFAPDSWVIEEDGSMSCKMLVTKDKNGKQRIKGRGYIWTKENYGDFALSLRYKLSEGANSGVFFRTDKDNPVQGGFEIQLLDNKGFQQVKGKKDPKNLNGALYDCQAAKLNPAKPVGRWNELKIKVKGSKLIVNMNDQVVNEVDIDQWGVAGKNPDGSTNKFKTALRDLPRTGRIGFQNHGQVVWIKDVTIEAL
jgi:hypothetical protein